MVWKARVPKWHQQTDTDVLGLGNLAFQDLALTGFQFKLLNISCSPCRSQEEGCGIHGGGSQGPSLPCLSGPRFDRWLWVEINKKTYGEEGLSLWGQEGAMKREFASWVWLGKRVRSLNLQMGKWDPVLLSLREMGSLAWGHPASPRYPLGRLIPRLMMGRVSSPLILDDSLESSLVCTMQDPINMFK